MRPYSAADYGQALEICIAAFAPIHAGFEAALGPTIFRARYHDWEAQHAKYFDNLVPGDALTKVYVAEIDGAMAGFIFTILDPERKIGEIGLNAVAPAMQGRGIGRAMYDFALRDLKARGAAIACVGTGLDAGHASARAAYESVGFDRTIPGVYYFKQL